MKPRSHYLTEEPPFEFLLLLIYLLMMSFTLKPVRGNTVNYTKNSQVVLELPQVPPRAHMSTVRNIPTTNELNPQMVEHDGYGCKSHTVVTEDGYILTLFQLYVPSETGEVGRPIFLQHGLLSSSDDWLINDDHRFCLAYILLQCGYDVWLGNCRGNDYSQGHLFWSIDDPEYWDFSFDEMAEFDIPAVFEYILSQSSYTQLDYIGHSMGCTMFLGAMSLDPTLMDCVRKATLISPAVYLSESKSPVMSAKFVPSPFLQYLLELLGKGRIIPEEVQGYLSEYGPQVCISHDLATCFCQTILNLIAGYDPSDLLKETVATIVGHTPSCGSSKTLTHFMQFANQPIFCQYDYGFFENLNKYSLPYPPLYDLSACKIPLLIVYGPSDWLVDENNVEYLISQLSKADSFKVAFDGCNHLDFLYAGFAPCLIYKRVFEFHSGSIPCLPIPCES